MYADLLISSFFKILNVIDKSITSDHLAACEKLIFNYQSCYSGRPKTNWILVKGYANLLTCALNKKRSEIE